MIDWQSASEKSMVCFCKKVTKEELVTAIQAGHTTLKALQKETTACTGNECAELNPSGKCCSGDIRDIITIYSNEEPSTEDSCCCDC